MIGTAIGAAFLYVSVPAEESGRTVAATVTPSGDVTIRHISGPRYLSVYLDAVNVPTACDGITAGMKLGQSYTPAQCDAKLEEALVAHAEGVIACNVELFGQPHQAAAAVSLAYNIGVRRWCGSTASRLFRDGRFREGCEAFAMWNKAGGRVLRGLVARRRREMAECVKGLAA